MSIRTYSPKASEIVRQWWVVDAQGQTLGRLASVVATKLRGKDKPMYAPHMDCGDFVVVVNASQIDVTGRKLEQKQYHFHSGYPGGLRTTSLAQEMEKHPDRVIEKAVRGMLPKTKLGDHMLKKLKVYAGPEHPHASQQPQTWELTEALTGRVQDKETA
jgi:large subunit ribosomal protein L13